MALNPPPVPTVDATGIHVPLLGDYLAWLISEYQNIYGADVYLAEDSQDGQWLAIMAYGYQQQAAAAVGVYNTFSPATAIGAGLSSVVKVNGIARQVASNSTVDLTIVGTVGTEIDNGVAADGTNAWVLPTPVIIPPAGQIDVTAVCATLGAIIAVPGSITQIQTPTLGWQTVTNNASASPGSPIEQDGALKTRQTQSTMLPSQGTLDGIVGSVEAVAGVTAVTAYENDDHLTNAIGIEPNCIALIVDGGDDTAVATAIERKKGGGVNTMGNTTVYISNVAGVNFPYRFYRKTLVPIGVYITIQPGQNYTLAIRTLIANAVIAYINGLGPGVMVQLYQTIAAACSVLPKSAYEIKGLGLNRDGSQVYPAADVPIAFFESASSALLNIQFNTLAPSS